MASNVLAQSVLDKISEGHLQCPICCSRFREPKMLDCMHSFCLKCLQQQQLMKGGNPTSGSRLRCPLCRKETALKEVADLPDNFTLSALVEEFTLQEQLLEGQGSGIKCQACEDEGSQSVSRCMDCDHYLCPKCCRAHERSTAKKSHKIYTMDQLQSGEVDFQSKLRRDVPKCGEHPDQNLSVYCNTCKQMVCTTCCVLDHNKPAHSLMSPTEASEGCRRVLVNMAAQVEKRKAEFNLALEDVDESCKRLDILFEDTNSKISTQADKKVARIRVEERKLKQELKIRYQERLQTCKATQATNRTELREAEQKLDEINRLVAQASCYEILNLGPKLLHNLKELTEGQPEKVPDSLSFMDFEEGQRSLGRLMFEDGSQLGSLGSEARPELREAARHPTEVVTKEKWYLKAEFTKFGKGQARFRRTSDVAVFSDHQIVVADMGHKLLVSYSPTTKPVKLQGLQIKGLDNPSSVSVNRDDQLVVLDKHAVKVFNRKHRLLLQFKPGKGPNSTPTCLAVDDSNLVAVGYQVKEEVSLHSPDGSLIRTLPAPMIGSHLAISMQRLIYTGWERKKLLSVDYVGGRVFSIDVPSDMLGIWGPTGVCCDGRGTIYVAVNGWSSSEVHQFSPEGRHLGCIIEECNFPAGITLIPGSDNLVVAATNSVKIFHHVQSDN